MLSSRSFAGPGSVRNESSITLTQILFGANVAVFLAMAMASGTVLDLPWQRAACSARTTGRYTLGPVVAAADLHVYAWRHPAHRFQYVVPLGSGCALRIALRALDLRRHLYDHRCWRRVGQRGVESRSLKRRRIRRNFRLGRRADRLVLSRRIFASEYCHSWNA